MSDLISRQAAIDALWKVKDERDSVYYTSAIHTAVETLEQLPPAQPERKKGRWIPQNLNKSDGMISTTVYYYPKCSVCGANANYTNFCPNCGADMREPEDIPMEYFESGGR